MLAIPPSRRTPLRPRTLAAFGSLGLGLGLLPVLTAGTAWSQPAPVAASAGAPISSTAPRAATGSAPPASASPALPSAAQPMSAPAAAIAAPAPTPRAAETPGRDSPRWKWDLLALYPSREAWLAAIERVSADIKQLERLRGTLARDPASLLAALDTVSAVGKTLSRIGTYANLKADEDTRNGQAQADRQQTRRLYADFSTAIAFVSPELIAAGRDKVLRLVDQEPGLAKHRFGLEDRFRQAEHTLSEQSEQVAAQLGLVAGQHQTTYGQLSNSDIPWPTIRIARQNVRLDNQAYTRLRQTANRADRKKVFESFFGSWKQFQSTAGSTLAGNVVASSAMAKLRGYPSSLAMALSANNIPESVYTSLVDSTNEGLPTLQRYLKLRARLLKLKDQGYFDIYAPLTREDRKFSIQDSIDLSLEAVKPLGEDYTNQFRKAVSGRWMHVYPGQGKRAGAYMNPGAYDVHPFLLLNHNDDFNSASTFIHEWGHAMHSVLANTAQPYETADYSIFVAEIASTANEFLLQDYLVQKATTDEERLGLLIEALERMRTTYFRQAMFAEFELRIHEAADKGEPLTGEVFTKIYLDILRKYHGHDKGAMNIDELYGIEWAYIPHFYSDFYVYQYATSLSAAAYFVDKIRAEGEPARQIYLNVLRSGGSDYPVEVLRKAGLDMTSAAPYRALVQRMDQTLDQAETLLAKMGR